ncbi:NADPH:quinone reductase [Thermodesulfobacteriota bacterium]
MKAIRVNKFGPPKVMQIEEVPDLEPSFGQVVVKVHAVGVNPHDIYIRSGTYRIKPNLPYTPGKDVAGTIESIGEGVTRFSIGDRVYATETITGGYAEQALCNESDIQQLPNNISFIQGAGINGPYSTAYRALFHRAKALPSEVVLIHGAEGGVGIAAAQFALAAGMITIGTGSSKEGLQFVSELGVNHVLNHNDPAHFEQALQLTNGNGVNIILEMLANVNLGKDLPILAQSGRVIIIGNLGTVEINPRDIMMQDASILGMLRGNMNEIDRLEIYAAIDAGLRNGTLQPIIFHKIPLAQAPKAHKLIISSTPFGKIVLVP